MPSGAFALVALFAALSVAFGILAWLLVRAAGGPRNVAWVLPPVIAAFAALYLVGHRLGLVIGPEVELFGFQVALFGDIALGFIAALVTATLIALVGRATTRRPLDP